MGTDDPGQEPSADPRLASLDERLKRAGEAEAARTGQARVDANRGYSQGNRVLAELIAGTAGGALIGWTLDHFLGTTPWFLLGLLFLGVAAAFRSIIRISNERPE